MAALTCLQADAFLTSRTSSELPSCTQVSQICMRLVPESFSPQRQGIRNEFVQHESLVSTVEYYMQCLFISVSLASCVWGHIGAW